MSDQFDWRDATLFEPTLPLMRTFMSMDEDGMWHRREIWADEPEFHSEPGRCLPCEKVIP